MAAALHRGGGLCPLAQNVLSGRYDMIMLSREYADSTHTHTHILEKKPGAEKRRGEGKEAIYLYVNGPAYAGDGASQDIASAAASVAGNEVRESQEIFSPTTLLFSASRLLLG